MIRFIGILFLLNNFPPSLQADTASQLILRKRAAVTVSPVRMYADSMYSKSTETVFTEGELFEIIGETTREHYDNTQNQTFKWFKVRSLTGAAGWIFGDNLAVVTPERFVDYTLKQFYKKEAHFDNGFENAMVWVASVEGHDDKYKGKEFLNPPYKEFYLVVTNDRGKCISLNYANVNESGKKDLQSIHFRDITDNKIDEIIIETSSFPTGRSLDEHALEVYSFKAGTIAKIFEERLTLTWEEDVPSPSYSKFIEIEGTNIRVAYVDYVPCDKYSLGLKTDVRSKTMERCLEYVTSSYAWDKASKTFKPLYKESRTPLVGAAKMPINLKADPSVSSPTRATIDPSERLQIIKHYDLIKVEKRVKKVENWLFVKHPSGVFGYVLASDLTFKNVEHAEILKEYYEKTPLMKQDWKVEKEFISVKK